MRFKFYVLSIFYLFKHLLSISNSLVASNLL